MLFFERQKQLGSTMGHNSGASPVGMVDVEISKQDMVGRGIGNSGRDKGRSLMGVRREGLIKGLVFRRSGGDISHSVHIVDHDVLDTFNRAPEA